ncbi:ATP-binding protein [Falsiroseomonas ponticola]|uniref:ATP-binding protein n=1 Tax=Falsiroseomonas ponticola TaxID=2786951 RepID=UPI0019321500|nr:ATP-binding protein [Roseomonas ponticola]
MIVVERLRICEFRGIRDLTLEFGGRNFVICGSNGTGKSGVVDALEFVLTGAISRLSGRGRGELSIRSHGPHVDCSVPDHAFVEAVVRTPASNSTISIRRTVKAPNSPEISPDTPSTRQVITYLHSHPEFALSRREITNYVLAEPGQRSKAVQELLKLDRINSLRLQFQKIARDAAAAAKNANQAMRSADDALSRVFGVSFNKSTAFLGAVNKQRALLGLQPLVEGNIGNLIDGVVVAAAYSPASPVNKEVLATDIAALRSIQEKRLEVDFEQLRMAAVERLKGLVDDAPLLDAVRRDDFLRVALEFFDREHCPVCDTDFGVEEFIGIIERKRAKLVDVRERRGIAEEKVAQVIVILERELALLRTVWPHANSLLLPAMKGAITEFGAAVAKAIETLRAFLPLQSTIAAMESLPSPNKLAVVLDALQSACASLPEPSVQNASAGLLGVAQERLNVFRTALERLTQANERARIAQRVNAIYRDETESALDAIYEKVQLRFSELYRFLNADDEGNFEAEIKQDKAGLDLRVDFYRRGKHPPAAYHSEGHQDSMGLCLYLALMEHLQGDKFTFAVLDDVLMSVDAGHRREVTRMLSEKFPGTQFALTTHDVVWQKFMQTSGLVAAKNIIQFRKWSVDAGPSVWRTGDVWAEIEAANADGNILYAATQLRNYLEYISAEACQAFRAKVVYNADGRYDLGDLLDSALVCLKDLYSDVIASLETWGVKEAIDSAKERKRKLADAVASASVERWQINPVIHFNEWCNLSSRDFALVIAAYKNLIHELHCSVCAGLVEVSPRRGSKEHLHCACGAFSFSFKRKPKTKSSLLS